MNKVDPKQYTRTCYDCGKDMPEKLGKYFCNRDCWDRWKVKNPIKGTWTIEEMQRRLLEMASDERNKKEKITTAAKKIFNI